MMDELPVVVVGAGPVGLAAAAELAEREIEPLVLERGSGAGAAVAEWGHVRLFSRWNELIDPAARRLLAASGWSEPEPDGCPTGAEWVARYLRPLATALGQRVRYGADVTGVARSGRDRTVDAGREREPLLVRWRDGAGTERQLPARAVLDASGTWSSPAPLGGSGLPALGEGAAAERISYRLPDLRDPDTAARFAGRHVVIAGSGHSALTALVAFDALAAAGDGTRITWLLRREQLGDTFGGASADQLPARGALGQRARAAADAGRIDVVTGFRTESVDADEHGRLVLAAIGGNRVVDVDEIVALTGLRPELSWLSEVRLDLDPALQSPVALAPLIDPNVHSCGTVYPHGARELAHPEPGLYLAGMKSYGRAPTFLALTGYEQVRSIAAELAGDRQAAERVELVLPETGVCAGSGLVDEAIGDTAGDNDGCCGPAGPQPATVSVPHAG